MQSPECAILQKADYNVDSPLCLNTLVIAPESLSPRMRDAWFFSSLRTKQPGLISDGRFKLFVAKPMPNTIASSTPKNLAVNDSNSLWIGIFPE